MMIVESAMNSRSRHVVDIWSSVRHSHHVLPLPLPFLLPLGHLLAHNSILNLHRIAQLSRCFVLTAATHWTRAAVAVDRCCFLASRAMCLDIGSAIHHWWIPLTRVLDWCDIGLRLWKKKLTYISVGRDINIGFVSQLPYLAIDIFDALNLVVRVCG